MTTLYPRTISIFRPIATTGEGAQVYGGRKREDLELIVEGIPASIQARDGGGANPVGLPADGPKSSWRVLTKRGVLADGLVKNGDVIIDDLKRRFAVSSDYTNGMGARFTCDRLEA